MSKYLWCEDKGAGFEFWKQVTKSMFSDIQVESKGKLGKCFYIDCCNWSDRQDDDICGLDSAHISSKQKMNEIVTDSVLFGVLKKVGLL